MARIEFDSPLCSCGLKGKNAGFVFRHENKLCILLSDVRKHGLVWAWDLEMEKSIVLESMTLVDAASITEISVTHQTGSSACKVAANLLEEFRFGISGLTYFAPLVPFLT